MDIVWFAEIKWDYLRTRKQQLIRRKPDDVRLLYLEPFVRGKPNDFHIRDSDGIHVVTVPFLKSIPGGPLRAVLDAGFVRGLVNRRLRAKVSGHIESCGIESARAGFVISNVFAADVATALPRRFLAYDCNDAHSAFPGMPRWARDGFETICRSADRTIVSSEQLRDEVMQAGARDDNVEVVGNGVAYDLFDGVRAPGRNPGDPVRIGYLGAIAPWFDFDVVAATATMRPGWEMSLIGPVLPGAAEQLAELTALPNVSHSGAVAHEDVPRVMSEFTVGLIPFVRDELTRGVNPNKMYEYLAAGVPVVATPFSDYVSRYPGVVWAAGGETAFVDACEAAIAAVETDGAAFHMEAERIAHDNDWDAIAERFWAAIRNMFGGE